MIRTLIRRALGVKPAQAPHVACDSPPGTSSEAPDLGPIRVAIGENRYEEARLALEACRMRFPRDFEVGAMLASVLFLMKEFPRAYEVAFDTSALKPGDAFLENLLGAIQAGRDQFDEAAAHYHRSIEADPDFITPLINLESLNNQYGAALKSGDDRDLVTAARERHLGKLLLAFRNQTLDPVGVEHLLALTTNRRETFPIAMELVAAIRNPEQLGPNIVSAFALAHHRRGDAASFKRFAERYHQLDPSRPSARQALGEALIIEGTDRSHEGWLLLKQAWRAILPRAVRLDRPEWLGENPGDGRLFVYQDQGTGDALIALRFLRALSARGIRFVLCVKPELVELVGTGTGAEEVLVPGPEADRLARNCSFVVPLLGLMSVLQLSRDAARTPLVLSTARAHIDEREPPLGGLPGRRIGLAILGNPNRGDDWVRSIPIDQLTPLTQVSDVRWVNLSIDRRPELDELVKLLPVYDPTPGIRTFADTAAIISQLDVVVAIDCSVAHLAAALGKPVILLGSTMLDWRWQIADDTNPWWPTVSLLRAAAPGDWRTAIAQLAERLRASQSAAAQGAPD